MDYSRNCPECGNELKTKNKYYFKKAVENNTLCGSCSLKGKPKTEEARRNMSKNHADFSGENNPFYGKRHTTKTKRIISDIKTEQYNNNILREKIGEKQRLWQEKNKNGFADKTHSNETKQLLKKKAKERFENKKERKKISNTLKKYYIDNEVWNKTKTDVYTDSSLNKMRLSAIERISKAKFNGNQVVPNYNINAIPIIEQKAKELGITDLQHAENGGEFYIEELGYWVDGYSKEKNIVIEYYEKSHQYQIERDLKRQEEIEKVLNCKFVIIYEN